MELIVLTRSEMDKTISVKSVASSAVQFYTVRARVKVRTQTRLDELLTRDSCHSGEQPPRHFVFLIDSSDSFNHYEGTPRSWSTRAKSFLVSIMGYSKKT